ncbi:hypothetical protein EDB83DRAFT_2357075 [Lactarius deliciosus]|nr:hypothetical protein EDB83DRAFT_2357075 [Lactarius deliciosus]
MAVIIRLQLGGNVISPLASSSIVDISNLLPHYMASNASAHGNAPSKSPTAGQAETPEPQSTPPAIPRFSQDSPDEILQNDYDLENKSSSAAPAADEQATILSLPDTPVGAPPEKERDTPGTSRQPSSPEPSQAEPASGTEQRVKTEEVTSSTRSEMGTSASGQLEPETNPSKPTFFRRLVKQIQWCFGRRGLGP